MSMVPAMVQSGVKSTLCVFLVANRRLYLGLRDLVIYGLEDNLSLNF